MSAELMWQGLERRIALMVEQFPGVAGVCVSDVSGKHCIAVNADEEFPTASTIKIHVLTQLLLRAERGEVDMGRRIRITPDMHVPGSGILSQLDRDVELTLHDLAVLMIVVSDNTATNLCIDVAGIQETNALLRDMGLSATTLQRKMQDADAIAQNRENVATPAECVAMLLALHRGQPSSKVAQACLEILKKPKDGPLNRAVPPSVPVANKPGGMERVQCDAGIVFLPRIPYTVAIMSKFGMVDALQQRQFVVDIARVVHETMNTLDVTNKFGLGVQRN